MRQDYKIAALNIFLIVICVVISYSTAHMIRNALALRTQSAEMVEKIEELRQEKRNLEATLAELQTKEAVEREAKERLNLKKPGEEVVVVVPEKKELSTTTQPMTFWEKIISFFNSRPTD